MAPTSIFDSRELNDNLFFPRDDDSPGTPAGATDFTIAVDGAELHARWHADAANRATVIAFHGNGEIVADYDDFAPRYRALGADLVVVDFRGYGRSTGTPTYRAILADALPAVRAVYDRTPKRPVIVLGRSLGGGCAAEIAGMVPPLVDGIVLESAASDLRGLIARRGLPVPPAFSDEETRTFDPRPKLARCTLPALVLHGERDTLIWPDEARSNHAALGSADKRLVMVPRSGHNDLMAHPLYWSALATFVGDVVAAAAT